VEPREKWEGGRILPIPHEMERHQRRREAGVPTVSVLVGPPEEGASAWRSWAGSCSRPVLKISSPAPPVLGQALVEWASSGDVFGNAMGTALGLRLGLAPDDALRRLRRATRHEAEVILEAARIDPSGRAGEFLRRWLQEHRDDASSGLRAALTPYAAAPEYLAELFVSLLPPQALPALLVVLDEGRPPETLEEAARLLDRVLQAAPAIPAAIAVAPQRYEAYLGSAPEARHKALLRETAVRLGGTVAAPVSRQCERLAEALRNAGANEQAIERHRRLSEARPAEALLDDAVRSEVERFFRDLLESLPRTAGLFQNNGALPIPFGARSSMEIDFLCTRYRLAIELDGYHHFQDPDRYRSDRAKDYLLQKQGYLVLRFLAEDVVSRLETILARIFDALDSRADGMT
jgi:hypothetical protein